MLQIFSASAAALLLRRNFFPLFVFSIPENVIGCKFEEKPGRETNLTIRTSHLLRKFKASSLQSGKKYTVQISKKEDARYKKFCAISFHFRYFKASILLFIFCSYSCFIWLLRMKGWNDPSIYLLLTAQSMQCPPSHKKIVKKRPKIIQRLEHISGR